MKNMFKKARRGFSLVELLIAVVVLGILGAMLIAAGTAAQNKARISVASNDIDSARNAVYTALMMNSSVQQYTDASGEWQKTLVDMLNAELDESWQWDLLTTGNDGKTSGPIAQTRTMRDPWKNPYTLFVYTDSHTEKYAEGETGLTGSNTATLDAAPTNMLKASDSTMTLVIASAGPNGTGVGTGLNGEMSAKGGSAADASKMINNTDGVDDIGVVMQLRNGSVTQATFGWSNAMFGTLEHVNWYFCGTGVTGEFSAVADGSASTYTPNRGSSLQLHPTGEKLPTGAVNATKAAPFKVDQ